MLTAHADRALGCAHRRIPADDLDAWLTDTILQQIITPENLRDLAREVHQIKGRWAKEQAARRSTASTALQSATARRARIFDLFELHGRNAPNLGDLTVRLRALNTEIRGLESQIAAIDAAVPPEADLQPADLADLVEFMREVIRDTEGATKTRRVRDFYASFVQAITVGGENISIEYQPDRVLNARPLQAVHSKTSWLPDLGSNQGPAD